MDERTVDTSTPSAETNLSAARWVLYAAPVLLLSGALECVWVLAAIDGGHAFTADGRYAPTALGWLVLTVGLAQLLIAVSIWGAGRLSRRNAIAGAACGALVALLCMTTIPLLSACVLGLNALVLYGVVVGAAPPRGRT